MGRAVVGGDQRNAIAHDTDVLAGHRRCRRGRFLAEPGGRQLGRRLAPAHPHRCRPSRARLEHRRVRRQHVRRQHVAGSRGTVSRASAPTPVSHRWCSATAAHTTPPICSRRTTRRRPTVAPARRSRSSTRTTTPPPKPTSPRTGASSAYPPCTTANGCFQKVDQNGGTNYPASNANWALEIALDLDMVSALCPNCHILLVEATNSFFSNLGRGREPRRDHGRRRDQQQLRHDRPTGHRRLRLALLRPPGHPDHRELRRLRLRTRVSGVVPERHRGRRNDTDANDQQRHAQRRPRPRGAARAAGAASARASRRGKPTRAAPTARSSDVSAVADPATRRVGVQHERRRHMVGRRRDERVGADRRRVLRTRGRNALGRLRNRSTTTRAG